MISLQHLTKRYGARVAVDDLTVEIGPGRVTGFLGPNGAGKSTTMRMVLGLDRADSGTALVAGRRYESFRRPLTEVGASLDARAVHPGRTARGHLLGMARSNGISGKRVGEVLEIVGVDVVADRRIGTFSLGMTQRLGIAAALLGDPHVLLLDEPINGLDPDGVRWARELMRSLAAEGRTLLVSSHLMSEMEDTADHLLVIGRGKLIADAPVDDVIRRSSLTAVTVRSPRRDDLRNELRRAGWTAEDAADGLLVTGATLDEIGDLAHRSGLPIHELSPRLASLEQAYLELTASSVEYGTADPSRTAKGPATEEEVAAR